MKNIMIKIVVVVLGLSAYFNVSFMIDADRQTQDIERLENTIEEMETLQDQLISQIEDLQDQLENPTTNETSDDTDNTGDQEEIVVDSCLKLYEISVVVIVENEDFNETVVHCTNESTLGDALDELEDDLSIVFDPRYDKEYVYGRMVHSFYGFGKDFEEYYAITIDGEYAQHGIDFVVLEDETVYTFTLTRWDY